MLRRLALLMFFATALAVSSPLTLRAEGGVQSNDEELDGDSDHDRARDLLEHGEIIPLGEIIAHVSSAYPGEVVGITLARRHGRWVYQFRILSDDGKLQDLNVDAKSMAVVREGSGD